MAWFRTSGDNGGSLKVLTASGDIASFETNLAVPLHSVLVDVEATGGNGTPDNPNPINGYSSANITRCGVNLWDKSTVMVGYINDSNGAYSSNPNYKCTDYVKVEATKSYYIKSSQASGAWGAWYNANKEFISGITLYQNTVQTAPANACYMRLTIYAEGSGDIDTFAINYPSTDTTYHAYNGQTYTIAFGQTVYGGQLDVTRGKLTVTHGKYTLDNTATAGQFDINTYADRNRLSYVPYQSDGKTNGTFKADKLETIPNAPGGIGTGDYQIFGSITAPRMWITVPTTIATVADFLTYISSNPIDVVYELATPFDIDLTPEVISAIVGDNNVWADCGSTTVKYLKRE